MKKDILQGYWMKSLIGFRGIIKQNNHKSQTVFSTRFGKQDEDDQVLDENKLHKNLNISQN